MKRLAFSLWAVMLAAAIASAATVTVPWVALGKHAAHDYSFAARKIPVNAKQATVFIDLGDSNGKIGPKEFLSGNGTLDVQLEISHNGGVSYFPAGGDFFSADKQPADFVVPLTNVNGQVEAGNNSRFLRGKIILYGQVLMFKADVEIE